MFDKDNKFGFINNNENSNNNIEGLDKVKADINNVKNDLGNEELTTTNKDVKGAINELNTQYKDIANVYAKKEDVGSPTQEQVNTWLNAHPEATTTVQDKSITPIKTDFLDVYLSHNLFNPNNLIQNKKVPMTSWLCEAVEVSDDNYCYYSILLEAGDYILNHAIAGSSSIAYCGTFGSDNENKIDGSITVTDSPSIFNVNNKKKYFFNLLKEDYNSYVQENGFFCLMKKNEYDSLGFENYFESKIRFNSKMNKSINKDALDDDVISILDKINIDKGIDVNERIIETYTNKVINWNGAIGDLSNWNVKLIKLKMNEKLTVKGNLETGDPSHIAMLEVFSNKTPWKSFYKAKDYSETPMIHISTKHIEYIMIITKPSTIITIEENSNNHDIYDKIDLNDLKLLRYRFNSAICVGDSLTVGKQPNDSSRECYPSYLAKMTDMTITNAGQSGATAEGWFNSWKDTYNYSNYECAFVCFGTNGGIEKNSNNYNAYISLIKKMRQDNPNIVIFLLDCVGNNSDGTNANDIIKEIANNNDCNFLNIFNNEQFSLKGINGSPVSDFHDIENDPTHLSPMGYLFMAKNIVNEMTRCMFENIGKFNQRHTNS